MTETPLVVAVVQRLGPATGGATQGAQGDLLLVEHATSGGYPIPVLAPVDPVDCYVLTAEAFRLAEELRTPVVLLSDKEVGMTIESVDMASLPTVEVPSRVVARDGEPYVPYRVERVEDVPAFAAVGGPRKATVTGSAHNERGELRKNDPETVRQLRHLGAKVFSRAPAMERVRLRRGTGARTLLLSFGVSARACRQVEHDLAAEGKAVSVLEVLSLFPVPKNAIEDAIEDVQRVVVVEENGPGLYASQIESLLAGRDVVRVNSVGRMITPSAVREAILS